MTNHENKEKPASYYKQGLRRIVNMLLDNDGNIRCETAVKMAKFADQVEHDKIVFSKKEPSE